MAGLRHRPAGWLGVALMMGRMVWMVARLRRFARRAGSDRRPLRQLVDELGQRARASRGRCGSSRRPKQFGPAVLGVVAAGSGAAGLDDDRPAARRCAGRSWPTNWPTSAATTICSIWCRWSSRRCCSSIRPCGGSTGKSASSARPAATRWRPASWASRWRWPRRLSLWAERISTQGVLAAAFADIGPAWAAAAARPGPPHGAARLPPAVAHLAVGAARHCCWSACRFWSACHAAHRPW